MGILSRRSFSEDGYPPEATGGADRVDAYVNGLYALGYVEGTALRGADGYVDDPYEELYWGGHSAWGM